MDNSVPNTPEQYISENGEITSLSKIYSQLAIPANDNFENIDQDLLLISYIELCYSEELRLLNMKEFLTDTNKLNETFVKLIKFSGSSERMFQNIELDQIESIISYFTKFSKQLNFSFDIKSITIDITKMNLLFVKFLISEKAPQPIINIVTRKRFKNIGKLFIAFCDYFDMPYHDVFIKLHDKLKTALKNSYRNIIGINEYKKLEKRLDPDKIKTLFDHFS